MITGLIIGSIFLILLIVVFKYIQSTGRNIVELYEERKRGKEKDDLIKYIEREKGFIHSMSDDPIALDRLREKLNKRRK